MASDTIVLFLPGDHDCNGCCSKSASNATSPDFPGGVLVDVEVNTASRLVGYKIDKNASNFRNTVVEWRPV